MAFSYLRIVGAPASWRFAPLQMMLRHGDGVLFAVRADSICAHQSVQRDTNNDGCIIATKRCLEILSYLR
jgi:hypothetical protein